MEDIKDYLKYEDIYYLLDKYISFRSHAHEEKVADHAEMILHSLCGVFTAAEAEYHMLQYSAMLHDIGCCINKKAHHKHTSYIIYNDSAFDRLPDNLRSILALVAAGHRKDMGKSMKNHNEEEQQYILRLASILRLADALDHTHDVDVSINNIKIEQECLLVFLKGCDIHIVMNRVLKKSFLFTECFNLDVKIRGAKPV